MCCAPRSLGEYVARRAGKPRCALIDDDDVARMRATLERCAPWFHNGSFDACGFGDEVIDRSTARSLR